MDSKSINLRSIDNYNDYIKIINAFYSGKNVIKTSKKTGGKQVINVNRNLTYIFDDWKIYDYEIEG